MISIVKSYIAGANKDQIEELGKAVIARQTILQNSRELALKEFRGERVTNS